MIFTCIALLAISGASGATYTRNRRLGVLDDVDQAIVDALGPDIDENQFRRDAAKLSPEYLSNESSISEVSEHDLDSLYNSMEQIDPAEKAKYSQLTEDDWNARINSIDAVDFLDNKDGVPFEILNDYVTREYEKMNARIGGSQGADHISSDVIDTKSESISTNKNPKDGSVLSIKDEIDGLDRKPKKGRHDGDTALREQNKRKKDSISLISTTDENEYRRKRSYRNHDGYFYRFDPRKMISNHFKAQLYEIGNPTPRVYWKQIKNGDLINWPSSVPIKRPGEYSPRELKAILANLKNIIFSQTYLSEHRKEGNILPENPFTIRNTEKLDARGRLSDYFRGLLSENGIYESRIQWYKLTLDDFIDWPQSIPIKPPANYTIIELEELLANLKNIRFSQDYLNYKRQNSVRKGFLKKTTTRRDTLAFFKQLYNDHFKEEVDRVPWARLNRDDFVGFPEDIIFNPARWKKKDFQKILNAKDKIRFKN